MLLVIIGVSLVLSALGDLFCRKTYLKNFGEAIVNISMSTIVICCISLLLMIISFPYNVDKKITLYEELNADIETKVRETVRVYMEYEEKTYKELVANADLTTLVIKYPELNSNELVKSEIELYKQNNDKIMRLKEDQISKSFKAWWLYLEN